jgi:hypothetical protein
LGPPESILEVTESVVSDDILSNNIAALKEDVKCPYNIIWNVPFDGREVDLRKFQ